MLPEAKNVFSSNKLDWKLAGAREGSSVELHEYPRLCANRKVTKLVHLSSKNKTYREDLTAKLDTDRKVIWPKIGLIPVYTPSVDNSVGDNTAGGDAAGDKPASDTSSGQKSADTANKPEPAERATDKIAANKHVADKSATKEPASKSPAIKKAAAKKPAAKQQAVTVDQSAGKKASSAGDTSKATA